jgi:hypothetical protein
VRDEREERLVDEHAVEDLAGVVVLIAADRDRIVAGRRDLEEQRLPARAGRRLHHVDQPAVFVAWNSSTMTKMRVQAVGRIVVAPSGSSFDAVSSRGAGWHPAP